MKKEPLTIEELKKMTGQPVLVSGGRSVRNRDVR